MSIDFEAYNRSTTLLRFPNAANPSATNILFAQRKNAKKSWKKTETPMHSFDSTQQELSNEYQLNRVKLVFNPYAASGQLGQYKIMQKTLAHGYSYESTQRELSNEYQNDKV